MTEQRHEQDMSAFYEKANILVEALPYIQQLSGKTVVIKYGGNAMLEEALIQKILQDITLLKFVGVNPIVVHGGGPAINQTLQALHIESKFHNGLRITDGRTMEVVQMVLTGMINKDIAAQLNAMGGKAIGLCGKDANLIEAVKHVSADGVDLGYVGDVVGVNVELLTFLSQDQYIPVIAPIGCGPDGESYNINADTAAGAIAIALKAEKLIFLTDIDGVRRVPDQPETLISHIGRSEIEAMIREGGISGGMIPKVEGCLHALDHGVNRTHILNGTIPHPILLEIYTDRGIGTMVTREN